VSTAAADSTDGDGTRDRLPACANCGAPLPVPRPAFCPACGQETHVRPPRIGEFLQQFAGAYLSTEGALWRTLRLLLLRPGELTCRYLAGQRKHFVLPLRLYLTISLVVLLALRLTAQVNLDRPVIELAPRSTVTVHFGFGSAGLREGRFFCDNLPAWLCRRFERRLDLEPGALAREMRQLGERFVANIGATMFVMLPFFALALKLVYLNRRLRYTEHLVFALHLHAFWFAALGLTLFDLPWLSALALVAVPVHTALAMRRVYGGRWAPLLLRAGLLSLLYGLTLALAISFVAVWSLLS
jgi:hypothetical protein